MEQLPLFTDIDPDARVTSLTDAPTFTAELTARMKQLHIQVIGFTWSTWHHEWHFCIRGPFGIRGQGWELMKTAAGVAAVVTEMEQRKGKDTCLNQTSRR